MHFRAYGYNLFIYSLTSMHMGKEVQDQYRTLTKVDLRVIHTDFVELFQKHLITTYSFARRFIQTLFKTMIQRIPVQIVLI